MARGVNISASRQQWLPCATAKKLKSRTKSVSLAVEGVPPCSTGRCCCYSCSSCCCCGAVAGALSLTVAPSLFLPLAPLPPHLTDPLSSYRLPPLLFLSIKKTNKKVKLQLDQGYVRIELAKTTYYTDSTQDAICVIMFIDIIFHAVC